MTIISSREDALKMQDENGKVSLYTCKSGVELMNQNYGFYMWNKSEEDEISYIDEFEVKADVDRLLFLDDGRIYHQEKELEEEHSE